MPDPTRRPFDALRRELTADAAAEVKGDIRPDPDRQTRTGAPEIVYGAGKTPDQVASALLALATANGRALATRCSADALAAAQRLTEDGWLVEPDPIAASVVIARPDAEAPAPGGPVGVIAAGTSDLRVAREIVVVLRELGCGVETVTDVGVAGLHRLVVPLERLIGEGVDVLIVVAGMDGALPSVVAGLVDVPVIGVPTSTGYGFGGDGTAALMAMLQSCAPGLTVVNIDNGVGAAIAAARIGRGRRADQSGRSRAPGASSSRRAASPGDRRRSATPRARLP